MKIENVLFLLLGSFIGIFICTLVLLIAKFSSEIETRLERVESICGCNHRD